MKRYSLIAATALTALLAGCNNSSTTTSEGNSEPVAAVKDAAAGAVGKVEAAITTSTEGFVEGAAISDMYEVQASEIALKRAKSPEVRNFAQQMIDAHTATTNEMKSILMTANAGVTPPAGLDARRQGLIDDLNNAKDEDFDNRYVNQQTNAHSEALTLFKNYADGGDNAALKAFAQETAPKIQMHLDMITALDKSDAEQPKP